MVSKSKAVTLASAVELTGSAATVGATFDVRNNARGSLAVTWSKHADETLLTVDVQGTLDDVVWFTLPTVINGGASISSGVAAAAHGAVKYTRDVTGVFHVPVETYGVKRLRVQALSASGGPRGTLTVVAAGEFLS